MKPRLDDRASKHSLVSRAASAEPFEGLLESDASPEVIHAQMEIVRVQEEQKTLRTWAICGTIVAGMAIISYASVLRQRAMVDESNL